MQYSSSRCCNLLYSYPSNIIVVRLSLILWIISYTCNTVQINLIMHIGCDTYHFYRLHLEKQIIPWMHSCYKNFFLFGTEKECLPQRASPFSRCRLLLFLSSLSVPYLLLPLYFYLCYLFFVPCFFLRSAFYLPIVIFRYIPMVRILSIYLFVSLWIILTWSKIEYFCLLPLINAVVYVFGYGLWLSLVVYCGLGWCFCCNISGLKE